MFHVMIDFNLKLEFVFLSQYDFYIFSLATHIFCSCV